MHFVRKLEPLRYGRNIPEIPWSLDVVDLREESFIMDIDLEKSLLNPNLNPSFLLWQEHEQLKDLWKSPHMPSTVLSIVGISRSLKE